MSMKRILILGAALPFLATAAHADESPMDIYYDAYKRAVPTAKLADIPQILSGERQAMIKSVGD